MKSARAPLQRAGSLVINGGPNAIPPMRNPVESDDTDVIPDSEEERNLKHQAETIVISSDSDDSEIAFIPRPYKGKEKAVETRVETPPRTVSPSPAAENIVLRSTTVPTPTNLTPRLHKIKPKFRPKARPLPKDHYYDISDAESELVPRPMPALVWRVDPDVIELTSGSDSAPDEPAPKPPAPKSAVPSGPPLSFPQVQLPLPLYSDDDEGANQWKDGGHDSAILTLNEPRNAWKPVRKPKLSTVGPSQEANPSTPRCAITRIADPTPFPPPSGRRPLDDNEIPATPVAKRPTAAKTPRAKTKAKAAEQERRQDYAAKFFVEINKKVFGGGLPESTVLSWNVKLLTTAGRAKWHRDRNGAETTEIELATKILDTDERIRNTLAHEMCHLATWILNKDPKESHGPLFKAWAATVMEKCPEIEVTTKHSYEINYPFEWECEKCAKVYGRFSKSIDPDACLCGACKTGKLVALFSVPQRASKTPKKNAASRLAIVSPQNSPRPLNFGNTGNASPDLVFTEFDSDSDVHTLTTAFGTVRLGAE